MDKTIRIVICDDETTAISIISASVEALFVSRGIQVKLQKFTSMKESRTYLENHPVDLIFLDIAMPEGDGIGFAKWIVSGKQENARDIIFVSSNKERVFETFAVQPFGFVRKDNFMADISEILARYIDTRFSEKKKTHWFQVQDSNGVSMLNANNISYIESYRNTQTIHLKKGDPLVLHSTMDRIMEQVQQFSFLRIHKGYIVNCDCIRNFNRSEVILHTEEALPVGRAYHDEAAREFMQYIRLHGSVGLN